MIRVHYPFHPDKTCLCIKNKDHVTKHYIPASYDRITEKRMAWMSTQSEEYKRNSSGLLPGITIVHHTTVNLVVW